MTSPARPSLVLACLLAACGAPDTPRPAAPATYTIDTLPGGIPRITNRGPAEWQDTSGWRLVADHVIDPPDESPGQLVPAVTMVFDATGRLYVMQRPARVLVFDATGAYTHAIGREGEGPGEIRIGTLAIRHDTLLIHQGWGQRQSYFALDGRFLFSVPSVAVGRWTRSPLITDTLGRTWLEGAGLVPRDTSAGAATTGFGLGLPGWALVGGDGLPRDTIGLPGFGSLGQPVVWRGSVGIEGARAAAAKPVPLQTEIVSSPRHDGLIVHGRTDRNELILSRDGRDTVRIITLPMPETPMTDADRADILAREAPPSSPFHRVAKAGDLPATWPRFTRMVVDQEDRLWLTVPGAGRVAHEFWVVDREGRFLGRVAAPAGAIDAVWGPDRVAIPGEDAGGRPIITIYRLEKKAAP